MTLFTFSTLQLRTHSIRDVVGGVTLEAAGRTCAEPAVVRAGLTAPLLGVVKGLRTGVQTLAFIQVTLNCKLIWRTKRNYNVNLFAQHQTANRQYYPQAGEHSGPFSS